MNDRGLTIRQVVLEVTPACNLDCVYCYNVWKKPGRDYPRGQLGLADLIRLIDRLQAELPLQSVAISGGEPFTRPDLPAIVAHLWARGIQTVVITNGTLLTRERIERTPGVNNYELPLLSYRREVHDRLTRRDAFDHVVEGALNLRRLGERFAVAFVATRLNWRDLDKTLELAVALGAEGMMYNRMNVTPFNNRPELTPSVEMVEENLALLEEFAARYPFPISSSIPIPPCLIDTSRYPHVHFGFCPLAGENSYFTVDPLGNLRVCNHSSVILGNLLEEPFWDLYERRYVMRFRTEMPASCQACPSTVRDVCHGGCKASAAECFGSFEEEEPFLACHMQQRVTPALAARSG